MRRVEAYEATARDLVARMTPEERQQLQAQLRRQRREHVHAEAAIEYRDIAVQGRDFWPW